jgi:multifunctional beta-oxidation protein
MINKTTGAGQGLGKTYAMMLASKGAKVVINDLGGSFNGEGSSGRVADLVLFLHHHGTYLI